VDTLIVALRGLHGVIPQVLTTEASAAAALVKSVWVALGLVRGGAIPCTLILTRIFQSSAKQPLDFFHRQVARYLQTRRSVPPEDPHHPILVPAQIDLDYAGERSDRRCARQNVDDRAGPILALIWFGFLTSRAYMIELRVEKDFLTLPVVLIPSLSPIRELPRSRGFKDLQFAIGGNSDPFAFGAMPLIHARMVRHAP
jgi:hypothetical protein